MLILRLLPHPERIRKRFECAIEDVVKCGNRKAVVCNGHILGISLLNAGEHLTAVPHACAAVNNQAVGRQIGGKIAATDYIDVQILLEGGEEVAWAERDDLDVVVAYDEAKDAERLDGPREHSMLVEEGMFWAALPHDAHRPCAHSSYPHGYRKIVMKLPVR